METVINHFIDAFEEFNYSESEEYMLQIGNNLYDGYEPDNKEYFFQRNFHQALIQITQNPPTPNLLELSLRVISYIFRDIESKPVNYLVSNNIFQNLTQFLTHEIEPIAYYTIRILRLISEKSVHYSKLLLEILTPDKLVHLFFNYEIDIQAETIGMITDICETFPDPGFISAIFDFFASQNENLPIEIISSFFAFFYFVSESEIWNKLIKQYDIFHLVIHILECSPYPALNGAILLKKIIQVSNVTEPIELDLLFSLASHSDNDYLISKIISLLETEISKKIQPMNPKIMEFLGCTYMDQSYSVKKHILSLLYIAMSNSITSDITHMIDHGVLSLLFDSITDIDAKLLQPKILDITEQVLEIGESIDGENPYANAFVENGWLDSIIELTDSSDPQISETSQRILETYFQPE